VDPAGRAGTTGRARFLSLQRRLTNVKPLIPLILAVLVLQGCTHYGPPRVAVMDFENATATPEYRALSVTVSELLTNMMANTNDRFVLYVVDRQDVNRFLGARYRNNPQHLRYDRWKEIGNRLDVDYFVSGAVSRLQDNFIINGRLYSVATGQVVPGSGKQVAVSRIEDVYPATEALAKYLTYQIQRRRQMLETTSAPAARPVAPGVSAQRAVTPPPPQPLNRVR